jgi:molybdenum-dependent DNA-binding transcriptional regulator ModE
MLTSGMSPKSKSKYSLSLHLRLRIAGREKIALGPGKAELLALIKKTGSPGRATRRMGMSCMKARSLAKTIKPLVENCCLKP